jgi:transcriptional regulator with XRE-family HTH domain
MRRKILGVSQQQLADSLGLTFQQVQKYERGANRISASKLYAVATALQTPVSYFSKAWPTPRLARRTAPATRPR